MAKMQRNTLLVILSFFAIYFIWGSTYLWNKIAVTELPAFMLAGIRFVTAGSLIFIISKFLGLPLKISKQEFKNTFIAGFLFLTFGNGVSQLFGLLPTFRNWVSQMFGLFFANCWEWGTPTGWPFANCLEMGYPNCLAVC